MALPGRRPGWSVGAPPRGRRGRRRAGGGERGIAEVRSIASRRRPVSPVPLEPRLTPVPDVGGRAAHAASFLCELREQESRRPAVANSFTDGSWSGSSTRHGGQGSGGNVIGGNVIGGSVGNVIGGSVTV